MSLSIPDVRGLAIADAAAAFASCGWFVGPLAAGSSDPASVLGPDWHLTTSREGDEISSWFAADPGRGVFLHAGRSGAAFIRIDNPRQIPAGLAASLAAAGDAPVLSRPTATRARVGTLLEGIYVFVASEAPAGALVQPGSWGSFYGPAEQSVIVLDPSLEWHTWGAVPELPADLLGKRPTSVHRGQLRIAEILVETYVDRLMHVYGIGWFAWDGRRWIEAHRGEEVKAVKEVLEQTWRRARDDKDLAADVRKCESAAGINGVLSIASAELRRTVNDLDADPYLLNTPSGTLDLRTLELREADPRDLITKVTRGGYRPDAIGRGWQAFLERVLPDPEVRAFTQRFAGLGVLGVVREHVLGIITGSGANGKSVFDASLSHALGDYAVTAEPDLFMRREGAHTTGMVDLRGARWVVVSETDRGRRLAEADVKRLTGGDVIKARRMRQDFVEFTPSHTAVLATNHLPRVSGDDDALWRRLRVILFDVVIPPGERDPQLAERLQLEADAIVTWAVEGYRSYCHLGLAEPEAVLVATTSYRAESDLLGQFIAERCIEGPNLATSTGDLWLRWQSFAIGEGGEPGSSRGFGKELARRGFEPTRISATVRGWRGIGLAADPMTGLL